MDIETTDTGAEQPGQDQEAAAAALAAAETAPEVEAGQDQDVEEKTPEQLEEERKAAEIARSKANTDAGVQKRIDKEVRRRKELEEETRRKAEEAAYWRGIAEGKGHKPVGAQQGQPVDDDPEPQAEDYPNSFNEYAKALAAHAARKAVREERAGETKRQQEQAAREVQAKRAETVTRVIEVGREEFEDFDDVTDGRRLQLTPVMVAAILKDPDVAHKVEYHLGTNLEVARKINAMDPVDQVLEIDKIKKAIRAASQPKTASSAPPPLAKVTGNSAPPRSTLDPNLSTEERIAAFRQKRPEARR